MKKQLILTSLLALLLSSYPSALSAGCKAPRRGPPGSAGAEGPTGPPGTLVSVYASSYTSSAQSVTSQNDPIDFTLEQVAPNGITHPVGGDFSKYQIVTPGVYALTWNVNARSIFGASNDIALYLSKNGSLMAPAPLARTVLSSGEFENFAGQTFIRLVASDVIQLIIDAEPSDTFIQPSSFTLSLIAP